MTIRIDRDSRVRVPGVCRRYSQSAGGGAAGGGNRQTPRKREPSGSSPRSSRQSATAIMTIQEVAPRRRCGYRRD